MLGRQAPAFRIQGIFMRGAMTLPLAPRWQGQLSLLKQGRPVTTINLADKGDVLFPQAQKAPDGRIWVAYERSNADASEIVLRELTRDLASATAN